MPSNNVTIVLEGQICVRCLDDGLDQPALKGNVICEEPADAAAGESDDDAEAAEAEAETERAAT